MSQSDRDSILNFGAGVYLFWNTMNLVEYSGSIRIDSMAVRSFSG
jgi:hypothetical protein